MEEYIKKEEVEYVDVISFYPSETICLTGYVMHDMNKTCLLKMKDDRNDKIIYRLAMFGVLGWLEISTKSIIKFDDHYTLLGYYRIWQLTGEERISYLD